MASVVLRCVLLFLLAVVTTAGSVSTAFAGNFSFNWGTAPYTWTAGSLGANTYTLTDQYGFQVQVRMSVTQTNGTSPSPGAYPDDLTGFGTQRSIWLVWDANLSGGGIGGSPNVATMEILNNGTAFGVDGLRFNVSDIDAVDNNVNPPTSERCDHVTLTGNAGDPSLASAGGTPTYLLGPGPGAGSSPALAANQAQCDFKVSTSQTSGTSVGDDNGTIIATYPNGTHTSVVTYNESAHNVFNRTDFNAAARGIGVWAATAFTVNNTISLDKQTTALGYTAAGNTISYSYVVTNNGPLPILSTQNIQIQDDKIGTFTCPAIPAAGIAVGGTHTCTATYTVTAADVTAGLVTNNAIAGVGTGTQAFASRLQSNSDAVTVRRFATLTLAKTVTNDNGGSATTAAFTLSAAGPTTISGVSGNAAVTNVNVQPGVYALSETNVTGYAASAWSCTAGSLSGSNLTVSSGQNITCTINNNDIQPRLTLVKTLTNDNGGTATTAAFTLSATGPTNISGVSGAGTVTNAGVNAGTYTLSETNVAGYAAGAWSCTAGTLTGSSLVLTIGQTATCTINNNDIAPVLTLVKTVTNDNGGTATTASFTLSAAGPVTISGVSGAATVTNAAVSAGTYTLSETTVTGYAAGAWSCTSGTLSGSSLTLSLGQTATCTINNNDISPVLTLVKTVTNDNGGTATTASFTLTATGPTTISGVSGNTAVTNAAVNAGVYTLSETNVAGYAAGAWSCTAGSLAGSNLTLALGQTATCTINNNDIGPVLTLVKTITGDGTPSGIPSFTLTAAGPVTVSGITGNAAVTNATISAGTYALSESGPAGYTAGAWSCTAGSLAGSNLTLSLGQTATCTINNIKLPTLTLRKISNGGTGTFSFSGTNGVPNQNIITTTAGGTFTGSASTLTAAATLTDITEAFPATFWQIQATTCTGIGSGGTATLTGNTLRLDAAATAAGSNIVCTFTNRRRPTVSVQKITTGGTGGSFSFADLNLTGTVANISTTAANTATPASPTRLIATTTGNAVTLTESMPLTFVTAGVTCSDANSGISGNTNPVATSATGAVTIPAAAVRVGADINCVFTNARAVPQLAVTKSANVASVSAAGAIITYTIAVNNTGNTTLTSISVTDPLGPVTCPSSGSNSITSLAPGGTENCTLTYTTPQSVLDSNGGGDGDIDNTASASATYNASPVAANGSTTVAVVVTPGLTIEKLANTAGPVNSGNAIGYTYRVTNTGNVTVTNVTINDVHNGYGTDPVPGSEAMFNDVAPLGDSADAATNASWDSLAPGDTVVFSANYTVVQADIDNLQ